ncbi:hypothetical protein FRACYDRAFT_246574 [Fragilariopsis cylindrus CCMP1102]|uniref:Uncharacterized protein n=1 Tax=Fragilariopsis cylindrus CCMP1102 TaxID=635003 RepID=A0A1E7EY34_9STRA|nr:hypothetical protein FRACYDRAFT_246574 [Fragilariopsis cylindrus CCMP1102]|eukprot:OEU10744.1 hypothetical protein FRACYDRAFT_246574 [Fragilariopsis cylindrus CCMP1102]
MDQIIQSTKYPFFENKIVVEEWNGNLVILCFQSLKALMKGVFRLKAAFHGTLATQLFDSNNMRDGSRQENSSKFLSIEMENSLLTHDNGNVLKRTSMDICIVKRQKKFGCDLVIWGKFYEDLYGWQADFRIATRGA